MVAELVNKKADIALGSLRFGDDDDDDGQDEDGDDDGGGDDNGDDDDVLNQSRLTFLQCDV